jgi:hypothetical protein
MVYSYYYKEFYADREKFQNDHGAPVRMPTGEDSPSTVSSMSAILSAMVPCGGRTRVVDATISLIVPITPCWARVVFRPVGGNPPRPFSCHAKLPVLLVTQRKFELNSIITQAHHQRSLQRQPLSAP